MNILRLKTFLAGIFGSGGSTLTWMASGWTHGLLSNLLLVTGFIPISVSIFYMRRINGHKEHIAAIAEARAQRELCAECQRGKKPIKCPIDRRNRPEFCPFFETRKKLKFRLFGWGLLKTETRRK